MLYKSLVLFTGSLLGKRHVQRTIHVKSLDAKSLCPQIEESKERRGFMRRHQERGNDPSFVPTIFALWSVDGTAMGGSYWSAYSMNSVKFHPEQIKKDVP